MFHVVLYHFKFCHFIAQTDYCGINSTNFFRHFGHNNITSIAEDVFSMTAADVTFLFELAQTRADACRALEFNQLQSLPGDLFQRMTHLQSMLVNFACSCRY